MKANNMSINDIIFFGHLCYKLNKNIEKNYPNEIELLKQNISEIQTKSGISMENLSTVVPDLKTRLLKKINVAADEQLHLLAKGHKLGLISLKGGIKEQEYDSDHSSYAIKPTPCEENPLIMPSYNTISDIQTKILLDIIKEQDLKNKKDVINYFTKEPLNFKKQSLENIMELLVEYFELERKRKAAEYLEKLEEEDGYIK